MRRHLVIPDTQVKPGVPTDHLEWLSRYIRDKRPEVIVQLGDWYDLPGLSSYDKGTKYAEGRRVVEDIAAGDKAWDVLMAPWRKLKSYKPELHYLLGNHENRLAKYVNANAELVGSLQQVPRGAVERGWTTHSFLQPVDIDGITYCHYFPRGPSGRITQSRRGAPSAQAQLQRQMTSCTAGHLQGLDYSTRPHPDGGQIHGLIAGSFYLHNEAYLTPAGNEHWRGVIMKHRVQEGDYDLCVVSLDYLEEKYG